MSNKEARIEETTKALIHSQTFWGAVVVIFSQVLGLMGYQITGLEGWSENIMDLVLAAIASDVTGALGAIWAMWGRWRATERITGVFKA